MSTLSLLIRSSLPFVVIQPPTLFAAHSSLRSSVSLALQQRQGEHTLQVARCSKIIVPGEGSFTPAGAGAGASALGASPMGFAAPNPQDGAGGGNPEGNKYVIHIKQHAKFVVGLGERVAPTDVEEGMRVG